MSNEQNKDSAPRPKQQDFKAPLNTNAPLCSRILCMTGKQAAQSNCIPKLLPEVKKKQQLSLINHFKAQTPGKISKCF